MIYSILFGLSSALGWGASDFAGGLASRRAPSFLVTLLTNGCGVVCLIPMALYLREPGLPLSGWGWCMTAGALDTVALVILYAALAKGQLIAAPVTALTAAALPVMAGMLSEGMPKPAMLAGLLLALFAVWFLSGGDDVAEGCRARIAELRLPLLAGLLIGAFLIMMHKGAGQSVVWPMVAMRVGGVSVLVPFCLVGRRTLAQAAVPWLLIALIAFFDVGGTACYLRAGQIGRMDVAAVLSSLYPGGTVFLSWLLLGEKLSGRHLLGVAAALGATALLTC